PWPTLTRPRPGRLPLRGRSAAAPRTLLAVDQEGRRQDGDAPPRRRGGPALPAVGRRSAAPPGHPRRHGRGLGQGRPAPGGERRELATRPTKAITLAPLIRGRDFIRGK